MAYWLFKSEPNAWGWHDQKASKAPGEEWDGVRNYQARNNMRAMQVGELGFFYHSIDEKRIVGIIRISAEAHPDTTDDTGATHGEMPAHVFTTSYLTHRPIQEHLEPLDRFGVDRSQLRLQRRAKREPRTR